MSGSLFENLFLWEWRRIFGKVFVIIRVLDCVIRVVDGKIPCGGLTVRKILCTCDYIEVAHLMDERPRFRVRACKRSRPKCSTQIDIVRLIRIHIGIHIRLRARAIEVNTGVIHRIGDGGEIAFDRVVPGGSKHTKPGCISGIQRICKQVIFCVGSVNFSLIS